jgi:hypothetical protein
MAASDVSAIALKLRRVAADPAYVRGVACALVGLWALACARPPEPPATPALALERWQAPAAAEHPEELSLEPPRVAATVSSEVRLRALGSLRARATCRTGARELAGPELVVSAPAEGAVDVECRAGDRVARAQVTFTSARLLPLADPYAGGVILLRTRWRPTEPLGPEGRARVGLPALDARLAALGLHALAAFPLDLTGYRDGAGLDHWLAIDVPEGVNFYQAAALLRASPDVEPESYLPLAGAFPRAHPDGDWPTPLVAARKDRPTEAPDLELAGDDDSLPAEAQLPPDLGAMQARRAWQRAAGDGVLIGVVDSGIDLAHVALDGAVRIKRSEHAGTDVDGNGVPGDEYGANFAHLALTRGGDGVPRLGLGLESDVSDWWGADLGLPTSRWGHGTALAALAAGTGEAGSTLGVAPRATVLAVDVQENLRGPRERLEPSDPRARERRAPALGAWPEAEQLQTSPWAKALGVVYAVSEGASVVTCAWEPSPEHWLLRDALLFADDACAVVVCAASADESAAPGSWTRRSLARRERETGDAFDAWTGETHRDVYLRPLLGVLLAAPAGRTALPADFHVNVTDPRGAALTAAASHPLAEGRGASRATHPAPPDAIAVGRIAGAVALVRRLRPDLDPWQVREALARGEREGTIDLAAALDAAEGMEQGGCTSRDRRREVAREAAKPWWKRVGVRVSTRERGSDPLPGSRGERPEGPGSPRDRGE